MDRTVLRFRFGMVKLQLASLGRLQARYERFRFGMVKLQQSRRPPLFVSVMQFPLWHGKVATRDCLYELEIHSSFRFGMVKLQLEFARASAPTHEFPLWHGKVATRLTLPSERIHKFPLWHGKVAT